MKKLFFIIVTLLSMALFFFTLSFLVKDKTDIAKGYYKEKGSILKQLIKESWYEKADGYIREAGYPFTTGFFIFIVILILLFAMYTVIENLMRGNIVAVPANLFKIFMFMVVPLALYIRGKIKARQNKIRLELCKIQDIMYFQTKIGTPDDVTLAYTAKAAEEPLKEPLQYLANAPKVKKSLEEALENLRRLSSITELQAFSFALAQKHEMGISEKSFKTQATLLKRNKRLRKKIIRQYKRTKLVISAILLFACYALLVSVPLVQEVFRSLDILFR